MYVIKYALSGTDDVTGLLKRAGEVPQRRLRGILNKWRFAVASKIVKNLSGGAVQKRSGKLLQSVNPHSNLTIVETGENSFLLTFKNKLAVYATTLETGGTVKPTTSEYLAIPLPPTNKKRPTRLRRYKNTFIRPSKKDSQDLVVYWRKKREKPVPIYLLKKEVEIPETKWFSKSVEEAMPSLRKIIRGGA